MVWLSFMLLRSKRDSKVRGTCYPPLSLMFLASDKNKVLSHPTIFCDGSHPLNLLCCPEEKVYFSISFRQQSSGPLFNGRCVGDIEI
jgi:hypothetical protein